MAMSQLGRRPVFAAGAAAACAGLLFAWWSVMHQSFVGLCVALLVFGANLACVQQYRFAAAESVTPAMGPRAIAFILLAPVLGALIGPELLIRSADMFAGVPYAGVFVLLAAMSACAAVLLTGLQPFVSHEVPARQSQSASAPMIDAGFARNGRFWLAVGCGVTAYGVMALIMTATPLSMHRVDGFELEQTANVIRSHVLAMYLPSLMFAWLVSRVGLDRILILGLGLLFAVVFVALLERTLLHYWLALVLLGLAWNFLYLGGTTLLTRSYRSDERFRAQAINECFVFVVSACASLMSGFVLQAYGWRSMILMVVPMLVILAMMLVRWHQPRVVTPARQ